MVFIQTLKQTHLNDKIMSKEGHKYFLNVMLSNINKAIFSADSTGKVHSPVSNYSNTLFGKNIVGDHALKLLFFHFKDGSEEKKKLINAFQGLFGGAEGLPGRLGGVVRGARSEAGGGLGEGLRRRLAGPFLHSRGQQAALPVRQLRARCPALPSTQNI